MTEARVEAICVSGKKGMVKREIDEVSFADDWGIDKDAHAGKWHRQVSLLGTESVKKMEKMGIIDGYEVTINPDLFKRAMIAYVYVTTTSEKESLVGEKLTQIADIQEVHFISGNDCYLTKLRCENSTALGAIIQEKIKTIEGVVSTRSEIVLSTNKETNRFPLHQSL